MPAADGAWLPSAQGGALTHAKVLGTLAAKVEAGHAGGRHHRARLGQGHARLLLHIHQAPHGVLLCVVWLAGVPRRRPDACSTQQYWNYRYRSGEALLLFHVREGPHGVLFCVVQLAGVPWRRPDACSTRRERVNSLRAMDCRLAVWLCTVRRDDVSPPVRSRRLGNPGAGRMPDIPAARDAASDTGSSPKGLHRSQIGRWQTATWPTAGQMQSIQQPTIRTSVRCCPCRHHLPCIQRLQSSRAAASACCHLQAAGSL